MNEPIQDGLYHAETGIPWRLFDLTCARAPIGRMDLEYGPHARKAALDDRFGRLKSVPLSHEFTRDEIFEVEVEQGQIVKFCARLQTGFTLDENHVDRDYWRGKVDLVLVCMKSVRTHGTLFVKTLWLNQRDDVHRTLDKSKYIPYNQ